MASPTPPNLGAIVIRLPSKYSSSSSSASTTTPSFVPPPLPFLHRTWTVTHSTLRMWRAARNVRITYSPLPPALSFSSRGRARMSDLVEHEPLPDAEDEEGEGEEQGVEGDGEGGEGSGRGGEERRMGERRRSGRGVVKRVSGVDTCISSDTASWSWRGRGSLMLYLVQSHWEVLGWGERRGADGEVLERWVVTWFRETAYTEEGVDLYSDLRSGASQEVVEAVMAELRRVVRGVEGLEGLVDGEMREVERREPWVEGTGDKEGGKKEYGGWRWFHFVGGLAVVATVAMYVLS